MKHWLDWGEKKARPSKKNRKTLGMGDAYKMLKEGSKQKLWGK